MNGNKKNNGKGFLIVIGVIILYIILKSNTGISNIISNNNFNIIASNSTKNMESYLKEYAKDNGIDLNIEYYGDLEIVDKLNTNSSAYDAVWISNSIWLYMLDNSYLTTESKSIVIDPVVMGITKSKAEELGFIGNDIYNRDILNTIRDGKLKYIMASVTKTNTGATSYLSFLNTLAGSPEVLTEEMLDNDTLKNDLKDFFKGVERVSGDEDYLITMYNNGDYNAMINYESTLISLNKKLVSKGKEPLYLIYPVDGVAINDMPFAYINNDSNDTKKKDVFLEFQEYLTSDKSLKNMEKLGYRSWYGGTNDNADKKIFNPEWGIDTSKYLKDMKYPSKKVINKAFALYVDALRKPGHFVFCLDVSGSMYGVGIDELKEAMNYILDKVTASKDMIQFSDNDKITIITFNHDINKIFDTKYGSETDILWNYVDSLDADGGTNIYAPSVAALKLLKEENTDEYNRAVILMTDGYSNNGSYSDLKKYYKKNKLNIPIYSITFGSSSDAQLENIANLTNGKVFDGKSGLKEAFTEVRSYS